MQNTEHLVLTISPKGFGSWQFETKYHNDLGDDLQAALDILEREGWQAAFSIAVPPQLTREQLTHIVLTRTPR